MRGSASRFWLLVACAVLTGAFLAREPWRVYREQRTKAERSEAEMRRLQAERADLIRQKARAESSVGREELARKHNYVREGEAVLDRTGR